MRLAVLTGVLLSFTLAPEFTGVTVEEGTELTKSFESSLRLELIDMVITTDGVEQDIPEGAVPDVVIRDEEEVVFVDEYVKVAGGRGTQILRTFETLSDVSSQTITPPGSDEEHETTKVGESVFADRAVRFSWDEDEEVYTATFDDDDASDNDADLLDDLDGDADFLFLLWDEPMVEGSSWVINISAFQKISNPSGNLRILDPSSDEEGDEQFSDAFDENLDGEMTGTIESIEDGKATILIAGEVTTEFEMDPSEGDGGPAQTFEFTFELEGALIWDLEAGHALEFEIGGDVEMTVSRSGDQGGVEFVQTQLFEGELESSASFE